MANVPGEIGPSAIAPPRFSPDAAPRAGALAGALSTDKEVIDVETRTHGGGVAPGFGGEWFARLHAIDSRIRLGKVRNPKDETVEIYNAADTDTTLDAITAAGDDGITLTGPTRPATIPARQSITYTLTATLDGPARIDAEYNFAGASTTAVLLVDGERLVLRIWPLSPDWSQPVRERWQWRTDLQRAKDGAEHRREIFGHPRRGIEYRIVETDIATLDRLLSGWQSNLWVVPRWPDVARLTAAAGAGDRTLAFDTSVGEWRVGGALVLLGSAAPEAPIVSTVNADGVELETALAADWPAGTAVYPGREMRMPVTMQIQRPTAGVATGTVQFLADEDTETAYSADESDTTFDGLPVWLEEPNRARPAPAGYARDAARIDSGVGVILSDDPEGDPIHSHDWEYLFAPRDAVDGFIAWLLARGGRLEAFRYPTWSMDLKVVQTIQPDTTSVLIEPIDWSRWYEGRDNRDTLAIETRGGNWYFARVTDAGLSATEEVLTLEAPLIPAGDDPVTPQQVRRACWLERVRLDSDRVEILWQTAGVATAALPLKGVHA